MTLCEAHRSADAVGASRKVETDPGEDRKNCLTTNLRKEWMTACAASGLGRKIEVEGKPYNPRYEERTLHDLRRSAVRNLINAGGRKRFAMQITGHKTRLLFDRYHIVSPVDVTDAMQAVEAARLASGMSLDGEKNGEKPCRSTRKSLMALSSRG